MPIIAISGASHSGKTTFINNLQNKFGDRIEFYDEIIRNYDFSSIDDIRKDASQYFQIQKEIISQKIKQEEKAKQKDSPDKLIIFDRSLADSIYYFTTYVNKEALSDEERSDYNKFFIYIYKKAKEHFSFLYDSVFLFEPIDASNDNDPYRPKNLHERQTFEYLMIKTLSLGLSPRGVIQPFNVLSNDITDFFDKVFIPSMIDYKTYSEHVENKSFPFYNVLTNKHGSLKVEDVDKDYLLSAALYSTNKENSDIILSMIKDLETSEDYMNSRCYPTGLWDEGGVMLVGEAPGQKGRSYIGNHLKPSFVYTKTSYMLRKAIEGYKTPYITNLLKYAMPDNNVPSSEFEKCYHIFEKEIQLMKPSKIVALGNNVYNYLSKFDFDIPLVKVLHPSATLYQGIVEDEYKKYFEGVLD